MTKIEIILSVLYPPRRPRQVQLRLSLVTVADAITLSFVNGNRAQMVPRILKLQIVLITQRTEKLSIFLIYQIFVHNFELGGYVTV